MIAESTDWQKGFVTKLLASGIVMSVRIARGAGYVDLRNPREVLGYMRNPDEHLAKRLGCTVDNLRIWQRLMAEGGTHCTGKTAKGKRCRNWVYAFECRMPSAFEPGVTDRCHLHKGRQ